MRIGIDLGGTKIEALALGDGGEELARLRVSTPREYGGTVEAIAEAVDAVETRAGMRGSIGIGIPGVVVPQTGLVKNANSTWLNGRPLGEDLKARLGRPVRLMNDANCFALSEASDGAGAGARVVFGVILGTGVGGGIVIEGQCHVGLNLVGGEWGHNPMPWMTMDEHPGDACYCGQRGCIETFLSGPALERDHARSGGEALEGREIVRRAGAGELSCRATLERYEERLSRALATVVNLLDPDVIVLGGGVSNVDGLPEAAAAGLRRWVFSDAVATRVVRHRHGDSSGVRGAAWLWPAAEAAGVR